ncbi:two pore domain potassium channel family protein, partial [Schumannella luteola]
LIGIWLTFIVDYVVRLALAKPRRTFVLASIPDAVAALLPVFRPVVQLRHVVRVPLLRDRGGAYQRVRIGVMTAAFAVVFVYSIALAVLVAERTSPDATITTFGEAIWWACVTVFTVGYGDYAPVTVLGRFWAVVLMIGGVAIIGVTSAIVVTYLGDRIRHHEGESADADGAAPGPDAAPSIEQLD